MNASSPSDVPVTKHTPRLLKYSRVGLGVVLALAMGGTVGLITIAMQGGESPAEKVPAKTVFGDELHFRPDEQAMYTISHGGGQRANATIDEIVQRGDKRFVPVLIEMLAANETRPIVIGAGAHRHIFALRKLVDDPALNTQITESLARQWQDWYATADIAPPDGFTAWKGKLLGRVDPRFEQFFQNEFPSRIRVADIRHDRVRVDSIPSLDHPAMVPADKADYLEPGEPVFGIELGGDARAYPQRILDWHQMMNDDIGGVPVTLSYCTLCGAGIAYDGRASDGKTYSFGTSGLLYHSNKLMYDHQTRTLWNQFTGRPVLGALAASNTDLKPLPVVVTKWESWRKAHPETTVLDLNTGYERRYKLGAAYGDYFASNRVMYSVGPKNNILPAKSLIFGIHLDDSSKAFPVERVAAERIVNDAVGRTPVVLVAPEGTITVSGIVLRNGGLNSRQFSYNAGGTVRAYERTDRTFHAGPDATSLTDADGQLWKTTEEALIGPQGQSLQRVNGFQSYWFAWSVFNPDTVVYP